MPPTIRPIRDEELTAWFEASGGAFYIWQNYDPAAVAAVRRDTWDLARVIGASRATGSSAPSGRSAPSSRSPAAPASR